MTCRVHFGQLAQNLDGLVLLLVELIDGLWVGRRPDDQALDGRAESGDGRRDFGVHVQVDPVVHSNHAGGQQLDLTTVRKK